MKGVFALLPAQASTMASQVDWIAGALLGLSGVILLVVFGLIITFCVAYRQGSSRSRVRSGGGRTLLEWSWTFATFFAFMGIFGWAAVTYFHMHEAPPGAEEISVVAKQWMWKFQHPGGQRELNELHIPLGQPVLLTMTSEDVIHSLFVPDFRVKQDVLPGRYTKLWFEASRIGEYHLFCSQYCGTMHAGMRGRVIVMPPENYQRWLATGLAAAGGTAPGGLSLASRGARLFTRLGCLSCHGDNPGVRAPSLNGIFGKPVGLSDGSTVIADENYLRESILNPGAKIALGYAPLMPSFAGQVSEEDVLALIAYVKELGGTPKGARGAQAPSGGPR